MGIPVKLPRSINGADLLTIIEEVGRSLDDVRDIQFVFRFPTKVQGLIPGSVEYGEFYAGETIVVGFKEKKIKRSVIGIILYPLAVFFRLVRPEVREIELLPIHPDQNYSQVEFQLSIKDSFDPWKTVSKIEEAGFEDFLEFTKRLFERMK